MCARSEKCWFYYRHRSLCYINTDDSCVEFGRDKLQLYAPLFRKMTSRSVVRLSGVVLWMTSREKKFLITFWIFWYPRIGRCLCVTFVGQCILNSRRTQNRLHPVRPKIQRQDGVGTMWRLVEYQPSCVLQRRSPENAPNTNCRSSRLFFSYELLFWCSWEIMGDQGKETTKFFFFFFFFFYFVLFEFPVVRFRSSRRKWV